MLNMSNLNNGNMSNLYNGTAQVNLKHSKSRIYFANVKVIYSDAQILTTNTTIF